MGVPIDTSTTLGLGAALRDPLVNDGPRPPHEPADFDGRRKVPPVPHSPDLPRADLKQLRQLIGGVEGGRDPDRPACKLIDGSVWFDLDDCAHVSHLRVWDSVGPMSHFYPGMRTVEFVRGLHVEFVRDQ
jgi:hypothetical protein